MSASEDPDPAPFVMSDEARAREETRVRRLRIVVIALGLVFLALALAVFSTLIVRAVKGGGEKKHAEATALPSSAGGGPQTQAAIPPGSRVIATAVGDGKLALTVESDRRFITVIFDLSTMKETGRVTVSAGP